MADWKTYAKAARNTARRQAPEARGAAQRAGERAGGYVRAAGRAIDQGRRDDGRSDAPPRSEGARVDDVPRHSPREGSARQGSTAARPPVDRDRLRKDAAAYYTVASRRVASADVIPRIMRSLRDALLIGLSLLVIWGVLAAAGIPIPFTTVLIIVAVIVVVSFAGGVYAQWTRARQARDAAADRGA